MTFFEKSRFRLLVAAGSLWAALAAGGAPAAAQTFFFGPVDFEGPSPLSGWTQEQVAGNNLWIVSNERSNSPTHALMFDHFVDDNDVWLITPAFDLSGAASPALRYFENVNFAGRTDTHEVLVSTQHDGANFDAGQWTSLRAGSSTEDVWVEREISLAAQGGAPNVHLAFRYEGNFADDWFVDDVSVFSAAQFEVRLFPLDPDAPVQVGTDAFYTVEIANSGAQADDFAVAAPSGAWTGGFFEADRSTPFPLGPFALDAGASRILEIAVQPPPGTPDGETDAETVQVSGAGGSTAEIVIESTAVNVRPLPFPPEGFEGAQFPPFGWIVQDVGMTDSALVWEQTSSQQFEGAFSARHRRVPAGLADTWLISPPIDLSGAAMPVARYHDRVERNFFAAIQDVLVCSDFAGDAVEADWQSLNFSVIGNKEWQPYEFDLQDRAGETIRIGFRYFGNDAGVWYVDRFEVLDLAASPPSNAGVVAR